VAVVGRDGWLASQVKARGLTPEILEARGSLNVRYLRQLVALVRRTDARAIVAHLFGAAIYASLAGMLTRVPVISILHGQSDLAEKERFAGLKRFLVARGSSRVVFVSEPLRDALQPRLHLPAKKVAVIENGIDVTRFQRVDATLLKQSLGLSPATFLVGSIGNVRRAKDYPTLLRAARLVCDQFPATRFVVAGDTQGGLFPELERLRAELRLEREVQFLGLRTDVPDILGGIDLFVTSSDTEGFSIALVEAMASGRAVLATRSGGPERIINDESTGLLVPAKDAESLARGISRLIGDSSLRTRLAQSAKSAIGARYSGARMLEEYTRVVEAAIAGSCA
jgi:glycosyltransferase involved in cell wall biosynthesis